jgi:PAS domain S-box-containing protein
MLLGLVLLEALSIGLFATVLTHLQRQDIQRRAAHRLAHQADSVAGQIQEALRQGRQDWVAFSVGMQGQSPSVARVRVTDPSGRTLYEDGGANVGVPLTSEEVAQMEQLKGSESRVFGFNSNVWEAVRPIYQGAALYGYVWIESSRAWDNEELVGTIRATSIFGGVWVLVSLLLVWLLARRVSGPLAVLQRGTRDLTSLPETSGNFPLPVTVDNEVGDLIAAFNHMVGAIEEQRAGLRDTLSLLDSMLANAPVGFAFFDRYSRFVRVNQVFADLTGLPVSRHLGRTPGELLPAELAAQFDAALQSVFAGEEPVNDLEFRGINSNSPWTWLVSAYPVRTTPNQVRWAGVIIRDVSERVRSEETLRKTEKLAATGRLAASIAHEINNPLEGLTNLLYLLRNFTELSGPAMEYVVMAEHQTRRIAEIAQKTLRFYRQSTLPVRARVAELVESILDLYKARMHTLDIRLEQECDPELTLFCYEGEIRQVLANLIGNAVDAMNAGGQLLVRARPSRHWRNCAIAGVRFTIADTGSGMSTEVRSRIFEAFFTTKEAVGTGLGLWVSQEIIQKHHGIVHVRSRAAVDGQQGSGTVFQLFIPDDESLESRHRAGLGSPGS